MDIGTHAITHTHTHTHTLAHGSRDKQTTHDHGDAAGKWMDFSMIFPTRQPKKGHTKRPAVKAASGWEDNLELGPSQPPKKKKKGEQPADGTAAAGTSTPTKGQKRSRPDTAQAGTSSDQPKITASVKATKASRN